MKLGVAGPGVGAERGDGLPMALYVKMTVSREKGEAGSRIVELFDPAISGSRSGWSLEVVEEFFATGYKNANAENRGAKKKGRFFSKNGLKVRSINVGVVARGGGAWFRMKVWGRGRKSLEGAEEFGRGG